MAGTLLPSSSFGFSWALPYGKDLVTKSLAPSFVFVDFETFVNTNIAHRLEKRGISAYVSINAPLQLLVSLYGWDEAVQLASSPDNTAALTRAVGYVVRSMQTAAENGAAGIVLCDDLCGTTTPEPSPLFVVGNLIPLYHRFGKAAAEIGIPIIFHSEGDIREYYSSFAEAGYAGMHIAHPSFEQTASLFDAAREHGLTPLGGLVMSQIVKGKADEAATFAASLAASGPALICDDGRIASEEDMQLAVEVFTHARALAHGE